MGWKDKAACRGKDIDMFFAKRTSVEGGKAIEVCAGCSVRQECLEDCLVSEEARAGARGGLRIGIRGGMGPSERQRYVRGRDAAG